MSKASILIVEDEFIVATDLEASLEDFGFRSVGIAPDVEAAIALASDGPDLALVDIHLRDGQTGLVIADRLANEYGIVVLFMTANPRMVLDVATPGVIGVLAKPCREELLAAALDYALGRKNGVPLPAPPTGLTLLRTAA